MKKHPFIANANKLKITESALHKQLADYLFYILPDYVCWTTVEVSNQRGGKEGKANQTRLKKKGVKTGWPDIQIFWKEGENTKGLCMEIKLPRNNPTDIQVKCHTALAIAGIPTVIVRCVGDIDDAFKVYNVPTIQEDFICL